MNRKALISLLIVLGVLILDQALKVHIKTTMYADRSFIHILGLPWAQLRFVENPGMAFGITLGKDNGSLLSPEMGKYILSIFRIIMVGFLVYLIRGMIRDGERTGVIVCFSLIIAGAIGNIIDSAIYGLIFSASNYHQIAEFMPAGGGYAGFLQGKVVDMFYFPLIDTILPDWLPIWGGKPFLFFRPIFNVADSAISVGVTLILLFYRDLFKNDNKEKAVAE